TRREEEKKRKVYRKRRTQSKSVPSFPLEMEEQETRKEDLATEEERLVYRRRRTKPKSTLCFLPLELTSEILLRLPPRSVFRFRCVSKLWSSITTDSYFIKSFETRPLLQPGLLVCFKKDGKLFVSSILQLHLVSKDSSSYSFSQPIFDRYQMEFPKEYSCFLPTESVNGLICFQDKSGKPIVWNPNKRQFLTLPRLRKSWESIAMLLGYDPTEGKHKLMCIPSRRSSDVCQVLTLGSTQESWRPVKTNHKHHVCFHDSGRCINGGFDVKFEKLGMIDLPSDIHRDMLINYGGRLACVDKVWRKNRLWILEDAGKHKWSSQDFLSPFVHFNESLKTYFNLKGYTHAGEFVFVPSMFSKFFYILLYDPVRNSFRRIEGMVDDYDENFFNKGLQRQRTYVLYTFLNHI
ncbi:hypothetical protein EUTSA_v10011993mg, partial [Eutrema salsugineum]